AIDYGGKERACFGTDPLKIIATGIGTVQTELLKKRLEELISQEDIESILLGYPIRMDGSDTDNTEAVRLFKAALNKQYPELPVILWDERFTSKMALQAMIDGGVKKKKRSDKQLINEVSATLMLQEYLQQEG
ncbi:UNVERIFIED_CONTAM: hypothetical protein GTU68_050863, partial [Idotea baltica]|nr:hypothetical protein [Idotea baltica]